MKRVLLFLLALTVVKGWVGAEQIYYPSEKEDRVFLEGLRHRSFYNLAKRYCSERLERDDLPLAERAILTSELIVTLNEWSIRTEDSAKREVYRREAIAVAEDFCQRFADTDWRLLVSFTDLKYRVTVARALWEEAELRGDHNQPSGESSALGGIREVLRQVLAAMKRLDADLQEVLRRPRNRVERDDDPRFTEQQWLSLEKNLQFELARAFAELARTYPAGNEDHVAGMLEAGRRFEVLSQLPLDHPLGIPSRLELAEIRREIGDLAGASRILEALSEEKLTIDVRFVVRAERIRIALANRESETLDQLLATGRQIEGQTAPQLDYAFLQAYLAKRQDARKTRPDEAAVWEARIREIVNGLRQNGPADWARRAELLVTREIATGVDDQDIDMNVYVAENAYRAKRWDDAVAAYDRARKVAEQQGDLARGLQLGLAAAAIQHEQARHREAWQRYHDLCERFSSQSETEDAAQLAIFHAGQLARENPSEFLSIYQQELESYLKRWPRSRFACEAAFFLGRLHARAGRWSDAVDRFLQSLELWLSSGADPEQQDPAEEKKVARYSVDLTLKELEKTIPQMLSEIANHPEATRKTREIAQRLKTWAEETQKNHQDQDWGFRAASLSVRLLLWRGGDPGEASSVLAHFLPKSFDSVRAIDPTVRMDLLYLKLECLAWLGQTTDVDGIIRLMREIPLTKRLTVLQDVGESLMDRPLAVRKRLGASLALVFEDVPQEWSRIDPGLRPEIGLAHAHLLLAAEREADALRWFHQLAAELPETVDIQEEFAILLARQSDVNLRREALERFRTIAQKVPEGSARWFRAKYMTAWLHVQLGDAGHALDMIRVLETIHPDLGGDELRDRFLRLKKVCEDQAVNSSQR